MQRIKVFGINYADELQKEIDEWLIKHPDIKIEHIAQSSSDSGRVAVSILYSFEKPKVKVVKTCPLCNGKGQHVFITPTTRQLNSSVCPVCAGTGEILTWVEQETEE